MRWMRMAQTALLSTALVIGEAAAADPLSAAPSVEAAKNADALFHEGMRLVAQQSWKEAEEKLSGAWALNPTYDVANNLGQVKYRLGKYRDAAEHLAFALKSWPIIGKREPRELAQKRLEEVRGHVGAVTIRVSVAGAVVLVDGKEIGRSPIEHEVFVEVGTRRIEAKLGGYEDAGQKIEAAAGSAQAVTLTLAASAAKIAPSASASAPPPATSSTPIAPPPPKDEPRGGGNKAILIAGGLLAAGGLGAGIGLTVAANGKASAAVTLWTQLGDGASVCAKQPPASIAALCTSLRGTLVDHDTFSKAAVVSFALSGVFALGTAGFALWASPKADASTKTRAMHLLPVLGREGRGVMVVGAW